MYLFLNTFLNIRKTCYGDKAAMHWVLGSEFPEYDADALEPNEVVRSTFCEESNERRCLLSKTTLPYYRCIAVAALNRLQIFVLIRHVLIF
jgi:hypothetical protein